MTDTHAWADGWGTWHVRVSRAVASPVEAAQDALHTELGARERHLAVNVWLRPVRVPHLDGIGTIVYREGTP